MDEFASEARRISSILNFWDFGFFVGALKKHAHESSHKRIQLVLQDYFKEKDCAVSLTTLQNEAQKIKEVFPECSLEDITCLLAEIGNEENRMRIVVKKLLKKKNSTILKRTLSADVPDDSTSRKKTKIANVCNIYDLQPSTSTDAINETSVSAENDATNSVVAILSNGVKQQLTPSVDSQSTITYSLDSKDYEVTATDRDILLSIIETDLKNENFNNEPSSSDTDQHSNNASSVDNLMPKIVGVETLVEIPTGNSDMEIVNNETYVSKLFDPMVLEIAKAGSTEEQQPKKINDVNMETVEIIPEVPASTVGNRRFFSPIIESTNATLARPPDANVASASNSTVTFLEKPLYNPYFPNNIKVELPGNVASASTLSSATATNGEFHLYKHLMEMFTNTTRKAVKTICKRYNAIKNRKPSDEVFSCIVSDLLELKNSSKASSSDDSQKSDRVNATIIVPHSPEEQEKQNQQIEVVPRVSVTTPPPHANQRYFQDYPLNLISRAAAPIGQIRFPVAPPPSVAAPEQRAKDMLGQILTDLGETAADSEEEDILAEDSEREEMEQDDNRLIYPLMEMFPEACPQFIRRICKGKTNAPGVLDDLISQILADDYPKRQKAESPKRKLDAEEQFKMLQAIFDDADPSYLQIHCDRLVDKPRELQEFIDHALETRTYPKLKDYERRQKISAQQKQYTSEFSVENFLEVIPDPVAYFEDPKRIQSKVDDIESQHYAICFLRNQFPKIPLRGIRDFFKKYSQHFLSTYKALEKYSPSLYMKSKRLECRMPELIQNIPLLQEIAYVKHRSAIEEHIKLRKVREEEERAAAKAAGLLQTCSCCFDDEVMPKDIYTCENGCVFCKECVRRGAEVVFGDGKLDFACLNHCSSHFSLQTLQAVLIPKMFSKVAIRKQLEEVKAAGIEDLEMCPFCDFATIPAKDDKLFRCLNPECMKESCRLCKEPSHVPLRCDEVEKEDDVKIRTYIENKMTEALLRTCYQCGKKFIKAEGCNKMTCSCGALMCYVCGKPVKDYKHFNGPGGDKFKLCPLYSDTNHLHEEAVLKGAEEAKKEIGVDSDPSKLKIDPTTDVQQHYKEIAKRNPAQVYPYVNPFGANDLLPHPPQDGEVLFEQLHIQLNRQRQQLQEQRQRYRHHHHYHGHHHHH